MKFSRQWLLEYLEASPSADEMAAALTSVGLQVEGIDEDVLDVEVTTNRPDAMCHLGLARELAVKLDCRLTPPVSAVGADDVGLSDVEVRIEDPAGCSWYTARLIEGVSVQPSPEWLQRRLRRIGLRPINNVVDVTNYVLWETGQPLHAFDRELLAAAAGDPDTLRIFVRRARAGERLTTLDGEERRLNPSMLVIADSQNPIGLAGVMGGAQEGVREETHTVLLESAHFTPATVRATARGLGMHTDASHRFERGVDPALCAAASARAALLLAEISRGSVRMGGLAQAGGPPGALPTGVLEHARLERFGGFPVAENEVERITRGLGFGVAGEGAGTWRVAVPSWRLHDFPLRPDGEVEEADLFEEVLRHVGLEATPSTLPALAGADPGSAPGHRWRDRVRDRLAAGGFAEAIDYAFYSERQDAELAALVPGPALRLSNPLSESYAVLRRSLLPGLLESARFNLRRGAESVALFEVGHVFSPHGETDAVAMILGGRSGLPWENGRELDVFDLKGAIETIVALAGAAVEVESEERAGFVAGSAGVIRMGRVGRTGAGAGSNGPVGHLGRLRDDAGDDAYPLYAGELVFTGWESAGRPSAVVVPSRHPAIVVDLTLRHPLTTPWSEIATTIRRTQVPELVSFRLVDRYRGAGVPPGAVATTMRFMYQAPDRSLEQEEVNAWHQALLSDLERRFGWREES